MVKLIDIIEKSNNILNVRVTPNASSNRIKIDQKDSKSIIRVYITATPEGGKANDCVIKFLSKETKMPQSAFSIVSGLTNRDKTIFIKAD